MLIKAKNANHLGLASFDLLLPNGKMSITILKVKPSTPKPSRLRENYNIIMIMC